MAIKRYQNGSSVIEVIMVIVIVGLVIAVAYLFYQNQQADQQNTQKINETRKKNENKQSSLSEEQKILIAAGCDKDGADCTIKNKEEKIAQVVSGDEGGGVNIFVAKENGTWMSVYKGNGDVPLDIQEKYLIPTLWVEPNNPIDNPSE